MNGKAERPMEISSAPPVPASDNATESQELFRRFADGDQLAADEIFHRYVQRLTQLARSRLSARLAARLDPDDVVMSAYRSFFVGARDGRFLVERGGDLWRLLVEITLHKLYRQVAHHTVERRSIQKEIPVESLTDASHAVSKEPTPEMVAATTDELEQILSELPPLARTVLELRLQGEDMQAIARAVNRNERTVRRTLAQAKATMLRRQNNSSDGSRDERPKPTRVHHEPRARRTRRRSSPPRDRRNSRRPDPAAPLPFDDFILHDQLGMGATGKVYRATQKSMNRLVAVKYLRKSCLRNRAVISRFVSEAQIVAGLRHPGIVGVHGLGRTPNGGYFIVMDLIEGGDLAQRLQAGLVSVADAVRWLIEAAEAIAYAHDQGVIHCDLKPSNLLLNKNGHVLVTDFGFARRASLAADATTGVAGTPAFMAPEQVESAFGPIGRHTDVYGLGAVLFALLTCHPPFRGSRIVDVFAKIVSGCPLEWPSGVRERLPGSLVGLCDACLEKFPRSRLSSASQLIEQLRGFVG